MESTMQPSEKQNTGYFWDLSKVALTSLVLLGFSSGCTSKDVSELIAARPESTPAAVLKEQELWVGKEVTIHAKPVLVDDRSRLYFNDGKYSSLTLLLDLRYRLETDSDSPSTDLILIDDRQIDMDRRSFDPKNITSDFVLSPSTYVVSGKVERYSNSNDVYLKFLNSMYRSDD